MKKVFILILIIAGFLYADSDWVYYRDLNSVKEILYHDGLLWLGTTSGIASLDMSDFSYTSYDPNDGLAGSLITSLKTDNNGNIWYSSFDGFLGRISENGIDVFFEINNEGLYINDFVIDDDILYIATSKGLIKFQILDNFLVGIIDKILVEFGDIPRESEVYSVYIDSSDNIWVGTASGAASINKDANLTIADNWEVYSSSRKVVCMTEYMDSMVFALEYSADHSSIAILDSTSLNTIYDETSKSQRIINNFLVHGDTLWCIGSDEFSARNPSYFVHSNGHSYWQSSGEGISGAFSACDYGDTIVFGLNFAGIGWKDEETGLLTNYRLSTPSGNTFYDFAVNNDQVFVLAKKLGYSCFQNNQWSIANRQFTSLEDDSLNTNVRGVMYSNTCMEVDKRGVVWMGSNSRYGVAKFYPDSTYAYLNQVNSDFSGYSDPGINVTDIGIDDSTGHMWVFDHGAQDGYVIKIFEGDNLDGEIYHQIHSSWFTLNDINMPSCIDIRGTSAWLGTHDGKVLEINFQDSLRSSNYTPYIYFFEDEIPGSEITSIAIASDNVVYIGTNSGMISIDRDRMHAKTIDQTDTIALPENLSLEVNDIAIDKWDNVWVATSNGVGVLSGFSGEFQVFKHMFDNEAPPEQRNGLLTNNIYKIGIDQVTQDVWFLGDGGIAVLKRDIKFDEEIEEILVYPNPVDFRKHKHLIFSELPANPYLSIFNSAGQPVIDFNPSDIDYAGRIIWNGLNKSSKKVASGIYLYSVTGSDSHIKGNFVIE